MSDTVKQITLDELEAKVRELAKARPDFVYEGMDRVNNANFAYARCAYVHEGGMPGCIFGHALMALGVPAKDFFTPTGNQSYSIHHYIIHGLPGVQHIVRPDDGLSTRVLWMGRVQNNQDGGMTWGLSVEEADTWFASSKLNISE